MRIVGGALSGRVLRAPRGSATRPTSEKVREAVFAILGEVAGARVLDLFAGSGALGIEALSRGAAHVTFVDAAKPALAAIRGNLGELGVDAGTYAMHAGDAIAFAARASVAAAPAPAWQLAFVDPPYASELATRALTALATGVAPGARVVVEHDRRHAPGEAFGALRRTDARRYGDTHVSFYRA